MTKKTEKTEIKRPFRIYSWNVNGLRACAKKGFVEWLSKSRADVVGVQEVRAQEDQLDAGVKRPGRWKSDFCPAERKGYSGVGMFMRQAPDAVEYSLGEDRFDVEGRLQVARFGALTVANAYFPNGNGKNRDNSRIPYKLDFYRRVFDTLDSRKRAGEPIVVMGDFNTAHEDIDLARPKQNRETSGFRAEEREELGRWLADGWVDSFRHLQPSGGHYTWWSQRVGVREKNIGWRIDYALISPGALPYLSGASIHPDVRGSDHCPIRIEFDRGVLRAGLD